MRIYCVVPIMNQPEVSQRFLEQYKKTVGDMNIPLLIVDNGSVPPVRDWLKGLTEGDIVIRNGLNEGVMPALNQAWQVLKDQTDYIFYTHNDVLIHEPNWGVKLNRLLETTEDVGVAGFYGAKGIGTGDIYRSSYVMQQLVRVENVSSCIKMDAAIHGFRDIRGGLEVEDVAVMDGFSLIIKTELLNKLGGFDRTYPVHHNYDNDICLESLDKGYRNVVFRFDAEHLGGRTDVGENWAERFGKTKAQIHSDAHPVLYNKWSPENVRNGKHKISLPIRVA